MAAAVVRRTDTSFIVTLEVPYKTSMLDAEEAIQQALNQAGSLAEARTAATLITSPPQNLMVADAAGPIAMLLTGRTPIRRAGDGTLPVPGWDGTTAQPTEGVTKHASPFRPAQPGGEREFSV